MKRTTATSEAATTRMAGEKETILVVTSERSQLTHAQRELQSGGYHLLAAVGAQEALGHLSRMTPDLIIVVGTKRRAAQRRESAGSSLDPPSPKDSNHPPGNQEQGYEICRLIKSAAGANRVPVLLIVSVWQEAVLTRGLEAGADAFLFAPYQEPDLLRSVRNALWGGASPEAAKVQLPVEIVDQDRVYPISAGRERLARLCFSVFEQLRQCLSALSWSRAEAEEIGKQLRQERQQTRFALMLPEAVQGIAHDLSNLLETVTAAATVLRTKPSQPATYRAAMDAALTQLGTLVETLQNWTVLEEGENPTETVDLPEVAQEVLKAALLPLRAPSIRVRVQVQGLPLIRSNRSLLFRSLSNLIWNAVQGMPGGGMLGILGYVWKHRVVLEVSDTGVGISETHQERIFSPHFSTKNGHSGMGLFLVRTLVQRSGGEISFASRPGRGSTFALSFPMAEVLRVVPPVSRSKGGGVRVAGAADAGTVVSRWDHPTKVRG